MKTKIKILLVLPFLGILTLIIRSLQGINKFINLIAVDFLCENLIDFGNIFADFAMSSNSFIDQKDI
jgi:hypothetical protein